MEKYLIKKGRSHDKFVHLEIDGHLVTQKEGRVGLSASKMVTHYGTHERALQEVQKIVELYIDNGYHLEDNINRTEPIVFDKAKWHIDGDFPKDLSSHQGYVHTGFFIGWLLKRDLFDELFKTENANGINQFLAHEITCVSFFEEYMDGIFSSENLTDDAVRFTKYYYGLPSGEEDSRYINDLLDVLVLDLPTIYHVKDTWDNFETIQRVINQNYETWQIS